MMLTPDMTWAQIQRARQEAEWESWRLRGEVATPAPGWHRHALCAGVPFEFEGRDNVAEATAFCVRCPVRLDCLAAAIAEERHTAIKFRRGVRGGLPATFRITPAEPEPIEHGTNAGYHAHVRAGEEACGPCKAEHAADRLRLKAEARAREAAA